MPAQSAPVQSLELFGGLVSELSIIEYVALMYGIRVCAAVTLAVFICGVSGLFRRHLAIMSSVATLTLVPSLLAYLGLDVMRKYLAGTPLCVDSIAVYGGFAGVIIFCLVAAALTASVTAASAKRFC